MCLAPWHCIGEAYEKLFLAGYNSPGRPTISLEYTENGWICRAFGDIVTKDPVKLVEYMIGRKFLKNES